MATVTEAVAPPASFEWKRWPETETVVEGLIASALEGNAFARALAERMPAETGTRFSVWVDHLVVGPFAGIFDRLEELGYVRQPIRYEATSPVFAHPGGIFPRICVHGHGAGDEPVVHEVAIKVDSVAAFSRAHDLGLEIVGHAMGPYRIGRVPGEPTSLAVVERRAYLGFEPFPGDLAREGRMKPQAARDALAALDLWRSRKRRFDDDAEGFDVTEATLEKVVELAGSRDLACHLVFEAEREYWQRATGQRRSRRPARIASGWGGRITTTTRSGARGGSSRGSWGCSPGSDFGCGRASTPGRTPAGGPRCWSTRPPGS